jgi:hypothetical protein
MMPLTTMRRLRALPYLIPPALLLVILGLWWRSTLPERAFVFSRAGAVRLVFAEAEWAGGFADQAENRPAINDRINLLRSLARSRWEFAGVESIAGPGRRGGADQYRVFSLSYAYLAVPTAAASAWSLAAMRRSAARWRTGHCRTCGYDLRGGNTTCPECGTPATAVNR